MAYNIFLINELPTYKLIVSCISIIISEESTSEKCVASINAGVCTCVLLFGIQAFDKNAEFYKQMLAQQKQQHTQQKTVQEQLCADVES